MVSASLEVVGHAPAIHEAVVNLKLDRGFIERDDERRVDSHARMRRDTRGRHGPEDRKASKNEPTYFKKLSRLFPDNQEVFHKHYETKSHYRQQ